MFLSLVLNGHARYSDFLCIHGSVSHFVRYINQRAMTLPDRMTMIRNSGVYVQSLTSLVDNLVGPTLQMLVDREQYNQSLVSAMDFRMAR
jgi:hypothetical protein